MMKMKHLKHISAFRAVPFPWEIVENGPHCGNDEKWSISQNELFISISLGNGETCEIW